MTEEVKTGEELQEETLEQGAAEEQEETGEESTEEQEESSEESGEESEEESEEEESGEETEESEEESEEEEEQEEEKTYDTEALVALAKRVDPEASEDNYQNVLGKRLEYLEDYHVEGQAANEKLVEVFRADERVAGIMRDVVNGGDVRVAIARYFDPEELIPADDDPDMEAWKAASEERRAKLIEKQERAAEYEKNQAASTEVLNAFAEERGLNDDQKAEFYSAVDKDLEALFSGIVTNDFLEKLYKGYIHDDEIKKAEQVGEIKGKNAKIDMKKKDTKKTGDGVPRVGSTQMGDEKPPTDSLDLLLQRQKERQIL